jgi:hypothetical protein
MAAEEVVVPFTAGRTQPASETRSTLLTTSTQALRSRGRFEQYEKLLPAHAKEAILTVVAGVWLPMDVAVAHYTACSELGLTLEEQETIGAEVGDRVQGSILGLMVRTAKTAGLTPWTGFSHATRLYERLFRGGSVRITKLGPKEARVEMVNNRLYGIDYFRNGFRGIIRGGLQLFCEKVYARELPKLSSDTTYGLVVSWV